ncbi:MAG: hypothetical protein EBQ96_05085 [Proteobacteria bacterium]|nr:hypothetical protein [Pseudomonadota bacterium]
MTAKFDVKTAFKAARTKERAEGSLLLSVRAARFTAVTSMCAAFSREGDDKKNLGPRPWFNTIMTEKGLFMNEFLSRVMLSLEQGNGEIIELPPHMSARGERQRLLKELEEDGYILVKSNGRTLSATVTDAGLEKIIVLDMRRIVEEGNRQDAKSAASLHA